MPLTRPMLPYAIGAAMVLASALAVLARPAPRAPSEAISLEAIVPKQFGDWQEVGHAAIAVVNPQTKELLDKLYSQVLTRTYVNAQGYRIMLSIAYGNDQRGALQAHKPEVCYPAQGFIVHDIRPDILKSAYGALPIHRLQARLDRRHEPVTYWFTVGERAVTGKLQKRLVDLSMGLTGRIPDGLLFRVSSIDIDQANAFRRQDDFVQQLLQAVPPADRRRLSGLDGNVPPGPVGG